jgi:hypothetical protein
MTIAHNTAEAPPRNMGHVMLDLETADTCKKAKRQMPVIIVLFSHGRKNSIRQVGIMDSKGNQDYYNLDKIYFVKSTADSIAYVSKKKLYYDTQPNNWITGFSLPRKATAVILHIPPREFALIPDSLIRPIPF